MDAGRTSRWEGRDITTRRMVGILVALMVAGCTGAAPTIESTPSAASTTPAQPSDAAPSRTTAARLYPYLLSWPEDQLKTKWRYASLAWDGETRIDHGNASTDWVKTRDGDLFAFGHETSGTASDVQAQTARQATEWHGCDAQPLEQTTLVGGGEQGILAIHNCGGERVLRWHAVHDGFGLSVMLLIAPDADRDAALTRFQDSIGKLTWSR